jgi:hypothetical protein
MLPPAVFKKLYHIHVDDDGMIVAVWWNGTSTRMPVNVFGLTYERIATQLCLECP